MGRIDRQVLAEHATIGVGVVHINHDDCPAGVDTRRRLYITRKDNGVILGYCHNCGSSGVSVHRYTVHRVAHVESMVTQEEISMPANLELYPKHWPIEAFKWVSDAGISLTTAQKYALAYDLDTRRVIIPKFNLDNELVMYQSRNVGLDDGPKYITVKKLGAQIHDPMRRSALVPSDTVVICEDQLSAIRIVEDGKCDAIPLYSSNVKFTKLLTPGSNYGKIIVWLDNDGVAVTRHRDVLINNLRVIGKVTYGVYHHSDPKLMDTVALNSFIEGTIRVMKGGVR